MEGFTYQPSCSQIYLHIHLPTYENGRWLAEDLLFLLLLLLLFNLRPDLLEARPSTEDKGKLPVCSRADYEL